MSIFKTSPNHPNFPFDTVAESMNNAMAKGATVHQKWTCSYCQSRQTMELPNRIYTSGRCDECGQVSQIHECNFVAIFRTPKEVLKNG